MRYSRLRRENQDTISRWANATFGTDGSNYSLCCRASQKLGKALLIHSSPDSAISELVQLLADTTIILYQLASRVGFDGDEALKNDHLKPTGLVRPGSIITVCNQLMSSLIANIEDDVLFHQERGRVNRLLGHLFGSLYFGASVLGHDMTQAVDIKMSVNRLRRRVVVGEGAGRPARISENTECFVPSQA